MLVCYNRFFVGVYGVISRALAEKQRKNGNPILKISASAMINKACASGREKGKN